MKSFIEFLSEQEKTSLPITLENIINAPYGKSFMSTRGQIRYKSGQFNKIEKNKWHYVYDKGNVLGNYVTNKQLFDLLDGNEKFIIS